MKIKIVLFAILALGILAACLLPPVPQKTKNKPGRIQTANTVASVSFTITNATTAKSQGGKP